MLVAAASASNEAVDSVVPEIDADQLHPLIVGEDADELTFAEEQYLATTAKKHVQEMLLQGESPEACEQLAAISKKDVELQVASLQKQLDIEASSATQCADSNKDVVAAAKKAHEEAHAHYQKEKKKLDTIHVDLGKWKYAELRKAETNSKDAENLIKKIMNHENTKAAKAKYDAHIDKVEVHKGAATEAKSYYVTVKAQAEKSQIKCACDEKAKLSHMYNVIETKTKDAQAKAWRKAELISCATKGKDEKDCTKGPVPTVHRPSLPESVQKVDCASK